LGRPFSQTLDASARVNSALIPDPGWSEWFKVAGIANAKPTFVATRFHNYELEAQAAAQGQFDIGTATRS
jgi:aspartate/methionine/tyrosine aminotransferase